MRHLEKLHDEMIAAARLRAFEEEGYRMEHARHALHRPTLWSRIVALFVHPAT